MFVKGFGRRIRTHQEEPVVEHVVITQPVHAEQVDRLRGAGIAVTECRHPRGMSADELVAATAGTDVLLCQLTDEVAASVVRGGLRHVATVAAGHDNVDVGAAAEHGVLVTHTPGVLTEATADLTLALMLGVARHLPAGDRAVRDGTAGPWRLLWSPMGADLGGTTLGVVGLGRIGLAVARRAHHGFGMRILYAARRPHPEAERELGAERCELDDLLARSHYVSLHAPLTPETRHLIDERALRLMRADAILVNTSRGGLVDEGALGRALSAGTIAGAGLDVLEHEPAVHPDLLAAGDRAVLAPHVGSATARTRLAMATMAVDDVLRVHRGLPPLHPVVGR